MDILSQFKQIKTFVFDVDGVLTDGTLLITNETEYVRRMHIRDGYALQLAIKKGYRVAIISGSVSEAVTKRLNKLGIMDVYMQVENKKARLQEYVRKYGLQWQEMLFMGDDIPDYEAMQLVGISCAPNDAAPEIKQTAKYISPVAGGKGCVRDVIEKVLKLNDQWGLQTDIASR